MNALPPQEVSLTTARHTTAAVMFSLAALFAWLALCQVASAQPTTRPVPSFIIAVFQQPVSNFIVWKSRGVNTLINCVSGPDQDIATDAQYITAAHAAGFYVIANHPDADCWNQEDESDGKGISPSACLAKYRAWKVATPTKPVFLNLDGRRRQYTPLATYQAYARSCDWIGMDRYPTETGAPEDIPLIGGDIDTLKAAAPGKRIIYTIGCSQQNIELSDWAKGSAFAALCRPPTLDEFKRELNIVTWRMVGGVCYFSHSPYGNAGGWSSFDSTTPEIAAALPAINAALTAPVTPPPVISPAIKPAGPLDGKTITLDGFDYTLNAKR